MEFQNVLYEVRERIAYVTVNRPKVLNALNDQTMEELKNIFLDIRHRPDALAAILTGAGEKAFIAGADINELATQTPIEGKDRSRRGQHILSIIENLGKPVVAAINGFALGGGCEIAMACTVRIASESAKLGQPEVKLGIMAGYGGTQRLVRQVGLGRALELLLTGDQITAQRAYEIGLVNAVYHPAELMPQAESLIRKMLSNGPIALKLTLEAAHRGVQMTLEEGLNLEATLFGLIDLEALGIEKDFLLYVGNFKRHKDIPTLLEAFERIKNPPQLVLAGSTPGDDSGIYEKIFANPRIRLLGFADGHLLRALYSGALLFVFPSLYEGFGYPPLEAMACGTPVLSSNAPALKEVLANGAEYFEAGNVELLFEKMVTLMGDSHKRKNLAEFGRRRAAEFQSEISPRHLLEIYKRLS